MKAIELDVLAFFRLCTFRVTTHLALGTPEDFFDAKEAAEAVRRVTAFF
jgi:hypothetical protein